MKSEDAPLTFLSVQSVQSVKSAVQTITITIVGNNNSPVYDREAQSCSLFFCSFTKLTI